MDSFSLMVHACAYQERYFLDMTFQDEARSVVGKLYDFGDVARFWIDNANIEVRELDDGIAGMYDADTKSIFINESHADDATALLHEMIHFYETEIGRTNPALCELLLVRLWDSVKARVPNLEERAFKFLEIVGHDDLESEGGRHGLLFLLKSFDIDLELGLPLGAVMGYGLSGDDVARTTKAIAGMDRHATAN